MAKRKPRYAADVGEAKTVVRLLLDTCVWMDLATEPREQQLMWVLQGLVREKFVELLVPQLVLDEWTRNRDKTLKKDRERMTTALRTARWAVQQIGSKKDKQRLVRNLEDLRSKVPLLGSNPESGVAQIDELFAGATILPTTEAAKAKAADRARAGLGPCHDRKKNSINDAVLIEQYAEALGAKDARGKVYRFVSKNMSDFSDPRDRRKPHPDIALYFSKIKSRYYTSLRDVLFAIDPTSTEEKEFIENDSEPRTQSEIVAAEKDLYWKIWYNRNAGQLIKVKRGMLKVVDEEPRSYDPSIITRASIKLMQESMKRVLKAQGPEVAGPWSDFEWGMLNGKMSALRWVLGMEWDFLDT